MKGGEKEMLTQIFIQNLALGYASQTSTGKGLAGSNEGNVSQFKDILDSINTGKSHASYTQKDKEVNCARTMQNTGYEKTRQYKTFKEVSPERGRNVLKTYAGNKSDVKVEKSCDEDDERINAKDEKNTSQKTRSEIVAVILAQMLGIDVADMEKLLTETGMSIEDLSDNSNVEQIAEGLASLADLDSDQEMLLKEIINYAWNEAESILSGISSMETLGNTVLPVLDDSLQQSADWTNNAFFSENIELFSIQEKFEKATEQLKLKFHELLVKNNTKNELLTVSPDESMNVADSEGIAVINEDSAKVTDSEETHEEMEQENDSSAGISFNPEEASSDMLFAGTVSETFEGTDATMAQNIKTGADGSVSINFSLENVNSPMNNVSETLKTGSTTNVTKADIFNQIVEKAKVLLDGEKSEMVMHLKPDSLGKLAMKITSERGIIIAEFVAESQQVKEILESNMQLLRNVLENQGLSVQSFHVSVRQDSSSQPRWNNENNRSKKLNAVKLGMADGTSGSIGKVAQNLPVMDLLNMGESRINLTA